MPGKISKLGWYWHRLHAMSAAEVALRIQKKAWQIADSRYRPQGAFQPEARGRFPALPAREQAPRELLEVLQSEVEEILAGHWRAFGHLPLPVGDPPRWHADNLAGKDLRSSRVAFKLDHRAQPDGADIKVIWEPNRWYQLVRLATGAWLLGRTRAQEKCIEWLHDWARQNPPFTGLNWTSGLETGIRLIQFAWIDAFLAAAGASRKELLELRRQILEPHIWYTWRYKSFGSSANNHLLGELAGLIIAQARWPDLEVLSAPLPQIGKLFEREVLAQFAPDGGNREQALGYHLFSWEFCWQSQRALESAGISLSSDAQERIEQAAAFYARIKPESDIWDFGDSDNAWVTPLFADEKRCAVEWWRWFVDSRRSPALQFWWGEFSGTNLPPGWSVFADSGYAVFHSDDWFVRVDASELGYLSMAPHGHLDALHVSVWFQGRPVIIDPGTGCYYHDKTVRNYLAGWTAHNSPQLRTPLIEHPKRFGTFLWGRPHERPSMRLEGESLLVELKLPVGTAKRIVSFNRGANSIRITDEFREAHGAAMVTRWKFAPGVQLHSLPGRAIEARSSEFSLRIDLGDGWTMQRSWNPSPELAEKSAPSIAALGNVPLESIVSPAFRSLTPAAYLTLEASGSAPAELTISPA